MKECLVCAEKNFTVFFFIPVYRPLNFQNIKTQIHTHTHTHIHTHTHTHTQAMFNFHNHRQYLDVTTFFNNFNSFAISS